MNRDGSIAIYKKYWRRFIRRNGSENDTPMNDPVRNKKTMPRAVKWLLISLATLLILLALLVALTPTLINFFAVRWLEQQGMSAQINDVRFDFNDGVLEIIDASAENQQHQGFQLKRFYIDVQWLPLFDHRVVIDKLNIEGLTLSAEQGEQGLRSIAGIALPAGGDAPKPETPGNETSRPWIIEVGNIGLADIDYCQRVSSSENQLCVQLGKLDWRGRSVYDLGKSTDTQPTVSGELQVERFSVEQSLEQLRRSVAFAQLDLKQLRVQGINDAGFEQFSVDGLTLVPGKSESGATQSVRLQNLTLGQAGYQKQQLSLATLGLKQLVFAAVDSEQSERVLLSTEQLDVQGVRYRLSAGVEIKQVAVDELKFIPALEGDQPFAHFKQLLVEQLVFGDQQLDIKHVQLDGLGAQIDRNKDGQFAFNAVMPQLRPQPAANEQTPKQSAAKDEARDANPLRVMIGLVDVIDSRPISFVDDSLDAPFRVSATVKKFQLADIDTQRTDQSSRLFLDIVTSDHGTIKLEGDTSLFGDKRSFNIQGRVDGLDLRPVGAYVQTGIGHRIKSGQLNAKLTLVAKADQLDSLLDLDLIHFKLKSLPPGEKEKADEATGLPLSTALNLLRDRDKSIHLKIPVTGDLSNPDFDPSNAINKAVSKAMTAAIINYYTPFGLVSVVEGLYNLATALRFEPVLFEPGSVAVDDTAKAYLDKMTKLMNQRPGINLSVCGFANAEDAKTFAPDLADAQIKNTSSLTPALQTQVAALANQRATAVKDYLIEQGVAADRLILCDGEYAFDAQAGVLLSI